ncbi:serine hydrolase domain-containing protein [Christiangramia sp. OXR-203]|uniref:serine hydrolase domain-containing protein n=1 Tax=Christiangramia sp. OXR-203 TaxID=3100176 RepID=UPI002AC89E43|nr:serine hydrolase domain-containing protein [Christiangramia sp. OXR-203]WPY98349.1 serine hydrolase domain-containing protein [Christiangramia sp. OXR-203]
MKRLLNYLIIGVLIISCNQQKSKTPKNNEKTLTAKDFLTARLDSIQKNGKLIGFGVAMVNENGVLYENGFGFSNNKTKEKYTKNTVQHIASVSKTLIGISLMKAKELGKLELDNPINDYLPFKVINPNYPNETISIRHLATHTSGINDSDQYMNKAWYLTPNQDLSNVRTDYPAQQLNPNDSKVPMEDYLKEYLVKNGTYYDVNNYIDFSPGERYNYSNIGATLCALIIEKATGMPFDVFTQEHILQPLGMTSSGWSLEDIDISKHSRLYRNDYSLLPFYSAITYPDGMLISSSSDMAKYLTELVKGYAGKGTLLTKESYQELFREQLDEENFDGRDDTNPYNGDYSPGLFIGHSAKGYVGHSGGDAGVGTWMYFDKNTKMGRYIVINTDMGNDNRAKELEYYAIWDLMDEYFEKLKAEKEN